MCERGVLLAMSECICGEREREKGVTYPFRGMLVIAMRMQHANVTVDRHADEDNGALLSQSAPEKCLK